MGWEKEEAEMAYCWFLLPRCCGNDSSERGGKTAGGNGLCVYVCVLKDVAKSGAVGGGRIKGKILPNWMQPILLSCSKRGPCPTSHNMLQAKRRKNLDVCFGITLTFLCFFSQ